MVFAHNQNTIKRQNPYNQKVKTIFEVFCCIIIVRFRTIKPSLNALLRRCVKVLFDLKTRRVADETGADTGRGKVASFCPQSP